MSDATLKARLTEAMKAAMRAQEKARLGAIRLMLAEIKRVEVDERIELDDARVLAILDKMIKQRRDSIQQFESAGRTDLVEIEAGELAVIQEFLPQALGEAELALLIDDAMRRKRRRGHEGHGQGHGDPQAAGAGTRRHGPRQPAHQGPPRLIAPPRPGDWSSAPSFL